MRERAECVAQAAIFSKADGCLYDPSNTPLFSKRQLEGASMEAVRVW